MCETRAEFAERAWIGEVSDVDCKTMHEHISAVSCREGPTGTEIEIAELLSFVWSSSM